METSLNNEYRRTPFWFLSYLWGMETIFHKVHKKNMKAVLILPMRNGNMVRSTIKIVKLLVLILPMRNGIPTVLSNSLSGFFCVLILSMRNGNPFIYQLVFSYHWVLILPMRNGNFSEDLSKMYLMALFLSYLWGMETRLKLNINSLNSSVLILPMRNGNMIKKLKKLYRNLCSYPTYEEWKHF